MRRFHWIFTVPLVTGLASTLTFASEKVAKAETCGDYGTNVHFEKTPSLAARRALKEEKLVCVLHVSGNFEDSEFT